MSKTVLLVAGEVSGDMHAAGLVRAVREKASDVHFLGIGGEELQAAGMDVKYHVRDMAVMGLAEVLRRYGFFRRVFREMTDLARALKPDLVVLVDYPGFNLRFAREVKRLGLKCLYYVCPQVWAWHRSRIRLMATVVDRLVAIFPFEPALFEGTGLRVDFVGHPLVDAAARARAEPWRDLPWKGKPRVALLPGSRRQEIQRILPPMWKAAGLLEARQRGISFLVAAPSEEIAGFIKEQLPGIPGGPLRAEVVAGATRQVLRQARAAMVASGTATLETALMECPEIIVYKTSWLTYAAGRLLVKVPHLGMVNLVAGRRVCPELIQGAATPLALASALEPLLADTPERAAMLEGLREVIRALGPGGAAERAASFLIQELA